MKNILMAASMMAVLGLCGCRTAHKAEDKTEHVAKKAGHAVGHATEKVGDSISHGGEKLQDRTSQ